MIYDIQCKKNHPFIFGGGQNVFVFSKYFIDNKPYAGVYQYYKFYGCK